MYLSVSSARSSASSRECPSAIILVTISLMIWAFDLRVFSQASACSRANRTTISVLSTVRTLHFDVCGVEKGCRISCSQSRQVESFVLGIGRLHGRGDTHNDVASRLGSGSWNLDNRASTYNAKRKVRGCGANRRRVAHF